MTKSDIELLKELCSIHAPSGEELAMRSFLLKYIENHQDKWKTKPEVIFGDQFQDCIILVFGKPRTAIFAHMDSIGYSIGYKNQLLKIGGPMAEEGTILVGEDSKGKIEGKLHYEIEDEGEEKRVVKTILEFNRTIDRGTSLTYKPVITESGDMIQSCYLDNRLGILCAIKVAETLENGAIVFSAWEEVGGGSVGYLGKFLFETYNLRQALISDITWITEGVRHGKGVAISMRDSGIPRRTYINKIIDLAKASKIDFQLEVESAGGSDGNALQKTPYPFDWCFIGAPEDNVHMPNERIHKHDFDCMYRLYNYLMKHL